MFNFSKKDLKFIIVFLVAGGIIYFLFLVRMVLLPFALGIILAYLFNPFIIFMRRRDFSRRGALLLLIIGIINFLLIAGFILFPVFLNELEGLARLIPDYINSVEKIFIFLDQGYKNIRMPGIFEQGLDEFLQRVELYIISTIQRITNLLLALISHLFSFFLAPIVTYYLLKDIHTIRRKFIRILPPGERKWIYLLIKEINKIFVGYLRGQIWVSIFVGVMGTIGLYFLKVDFYLIFGILTGITNMIPYIGPLIGSLPAVLFAFVSSPLKALAVILLFVLIQQVESMIIAPKILSENVGLHPLLVIFSLLAGAELMGVWGLLFAVPIAGSIKVIAVFILRRLDFEQS